VPPNGMMCIPDTIKILCVLVQRMHNNFYHMRIGDLNPIIRVASQILTSVLNGLPVWYCYIQQDVPHVGLDRWPVNDTLHNCVNVR
jgi:hypothetical protein